MNAKPISENKRGCGPLFLSLFGSLFLIVGLVATWFILLMPLFSWQAAKSWPSTEATIVGSEIITNHDSDGNTYRAEFTYTYVVAGQAYENNQYSFMNYSGSYAHAKNLQSEHRIGSTAPCFYNPNDPANSVMDRTMGAQFFFGLIPLLFVIIGGVILWGALTRGWGNVTSAKRRAGSMEAASTPTSLSALDGQHPDDQLDQEFEGPLKLKPAWSKAATLGFVLLFSLIWNGVVSVFVFNAFGEDFSIFITLFLIPFVLVGLGSLVFCVYTFLGLFNPKIEVALSNGAIRLGHEADIAWEVVGNANRFAKLEIVVEGEECATYRRGTNTYTDTNTFHKFVVASTTVQDEIQFGTATIKIPVDTMHSFDSGNNEVRWKIKVHGDIPRWPDVNEDLAFRVRPQ